MVNKLNVSGNIFMYKSRCIAYNLIICNLKLLSPCRFYSLLSFYLICYPYWYFTVFFGFTFLNIVYFSKYSCTNIFHRRSLVTFKLRLITTLNITDVLCGITAICSNFRVSVDVVISMVSCQKALPAMLTHGKWNPFGRIPSIHRHKYRDLYINSVFRELCNHISFP